MTLPNEIQKKVDQLNSCIDSVRAYCTDIRDDMDIDDMKFPEREDLTYSLEEIEINCDDSEFQLEEFITND